MKKLFILFIALICVFALVACDDGAVDNTPVSYDPSFEISVEGPVNQSEDNLMDVTFTATIKNFEGEIEWYVNSVARGVHTSTFTFRPTIEGLYRVYYKVVPVDGEEQRSITKEIRVISGARAFINVDVKDQSTLEQFVDDYKTVEFSANVTGTYQGEEQLTWYVNGEADKSSIGNTTFTYTPSALGSVEVYAKIGDKFKSNFYNIHTTLGKVLLSSNGNVEQIEGDSEEVVINAQTKGQTALDDVEWYINGEKQLSTGGTLSFTPSVVGVYKILAKSNGVESEGFYVIYGKAVSNENEFKDEVSKGTKAIVLTSDIYATSQLSISKEIAIAGQGHIINNVIGTLNGLSINASNVVLYNTKFNDAGKYNVQFYQSENSYVEKCTFIGAGYSGIHVNRSTVTIKDVVITGSNFAGVEISHPDYNKVGTDWYNKQAKVTVLGSYEYEANLPVPIYTMYNQDSCALQSNDFNEFTLTGMVLGEERVIRRWCNDGCNIGWVVKAPLKTDYKVGEQLDFEGVALRATVCGEDYIFDYSYVNMAIEYDFEVYVEFVNQDNEALDRWYIVGTNVENGLPLFKNADGDVLDGKLMNTSVTRVNIYMASLYVGYYNISIS